MSTNNIYLESKPRYEILDGLRGVAAMLVVAFHLFETYSKGPQFQIINHGYLAVDFFFCLSGFVIGYAYDDRWGKMTTWDFFKRRIIRLHPMVIMGAFIGLLLFYFGGAPSFAMVDETPWSTVLLMFLIACTMIPVPASMDIRGWAETYPLNGATWSLMIEYIGNILYALIIRHLPKMALGACVAVFAVLTIMLGMNIDPLGIWEPRQYAAYTMIGGWGIDATQFSIGMIRLLYPFFCGLLISRCGKFITVKGGFWVCAAIVALTQALPRIGGTDPSGWWMNGVYETVVVLFIFPLVVAMGAGSKTVGAFTTRICKFLGEVSFPLYITHYPWIYVQMQWKAAHPEAPLSQHIMVSVCVFIISVAMAYGTLKIYDEPVREWLKNKWFTRVKKA